MIDVANKWEDGDMKKSIGKSNCQSHEKSYLSWNKRYSKDDVFEHLYELSVEN
jgi:hypothetical protein